MSSIEENRLALAQAAEETRGVASGPEDVTRENYGGIQGRLQNIAQQLGDILQEVGALPELYEGADTGANMATNDLDGLADRVARIGEGSTQATIPALAVELAGLATKARPGQRAEKRQDLIGKTAKALQQAAEHIGSLTDDAAAMVGETENLQQSTMQTAGNIDAVASGL